MKKRDSISILAIGEIIALSLIFTIKNLGLWVNEAWWLMLVLPLLGWLALWVAQWLGRRWSIIWQFAKFVAVGLANTGVDFGILNILILVGGVASGLTYSFYKGISFLVATIHSYFWNKFWTFDQREMKKVGQEFLQFFVVSIVGLVINVTIASLVVNLIGPQVGISARGWANVGAAAGSITALAWNFVGYKFIVFKK